jgi:hypothetical protein
MASLAMIAELPVHYKTRLVQAKLSKNWQILGRELLSSLLDLRKTRLSVLSRLKMT